MGAPLEDLIGKLFGDWTVLAPSDIRTKGKKRQWIVKCVCGETGLVSTGNLNSGKSTKCAACLVKSRTKPERKVNHPLYRTWVGMLERCSNPNHVASKRYLGKGITVCAEWLDFDTFVRDMHPKPGPNYSLDRRDNNGPYCKENCRWALAKEQNLNRSDNVLLDLNGVVKPLSQWAADLNMNKTALWSRIFKLGWSPEKALTTPIREK